MFLRSALCVGCARGFEIVTLDTLVTQPLLDQADTSLDFVAQKEHLKPIHVERISQTFLLCYSDFSFFVDKNGWRAFPEWKITWEGVPQAFAIFQPYILAFEPNFIEIRNLETGAFVYTLTARNVRMLHSSTREVYFDSNVEGRIDMLTTTHRFYMLTKTSKARMSLPVSISGRTEGHEANIQDAEYWQVSGALFICTKCKSTNIS